MIKALIICQRFGIRTEPHDTASSRLRDGNGNRCKGPACLRWLALTPVVAQASLSAPRNVAWLGRVSGPVRVSTPTTLCSVTHAD